MNPRTSKYFSLPRTTFAAIVGCSLWACGTADTQEPIRQEIQAQVVAWRAGTTYAVGAQVSYSGTTYNCLQGHTAQTGWEPPNTPALWTAEAPADGSWQPQVTYSVGTEVIYDGQLYECLQSHTAYQGWEPPNAPALWTHLGPAPVPTPTPWVARHGMTSAKYQEEFDHWTGLGYRPVHASGYDIDGSPRFAAIWEKVDGPAWVARHGLTSAQYQAEFDHWVGLGYRLTVVDGYEEAGSARYVAIWEQKSGPAWQARHGMTGSQYQNEFDQLTNQGYRLTWVQGYGVGNDVQYAAIWEQTSGPAWVARHGLTSAEYQAKFDELTGLGYRPAHVSSYDVGGVDYYAAIWEQEGGPAWIARHGLSSGGYQHDFTDYSMRGYRLVQVDGSAPSGVDRYAGVWRAEPNAVTGQYCTTDWCFDLEQFADEIENALSGNVVKWGLEVRRGLDVIQRAEGPALTTPVNVDFTVHQRFNHASVGKAYTSVAILQLLEKNGLSVDDVVHPYFPSDWNIPPNNETITFLELMNHNAGFIFDGVNDDLTYAGVKNVMETEIDLNDKYSLSYWDRYRNMNFAILRVLVASLAGVDWTNSPEVTTAAVFTEYVQNNVFGPLGIYDVSYAPESPAPVLFFPNPPGTSPGTTYGDNTLQPGSMSSHVSVHEVAMFTDATFKKVILPGHFVDDISARQFGLEQYATLPDGSECWGKGGFFPGKDADGNPWNGGAELSTSAVHCENGVTAMIAINGFVNAGGTFNNAIAAAFTAR